MDTQLLIEQVKAQIDRDFPIRRKQITMTPLHKDCVFLIGSASKSKPMRMREIIFILIGDDPDAPGWVDRVCCLAEALHELKEAGILEVSAVGWTKPKGAYE